MLDITLESEIEFANFFCAARLLNELTGVREQLGLISPRENGPRLVNDCVIKAFKVYLGRPIVRDHV